MVRSLAAIQSQIRGPTIRHQIPWETQADPSGLSFLLFQKSLNSIWFQQRSTVGRKPGGAGVTVRPDHPQPRPSLPHQLLHPPAVEGGIQKGCELRKVTARVMGVRGWLCSGSGKATFPEGPRALREQAPGRVPSLLLWFCVLCVSG